MNHVRGFVRQVSLSSLAALELQTKEAHQPRSCFAPATFLDRNGVRAELHLLNPSTLLSLLDSITGDGALPMLDEIRRIHSNSNFLSSQNPVEKKDRQQDSIHSDPNALYVKYTSEHTAREVLNRQLRMIAKLRGRCLADDVRRVDALVQRLLEVNPDGSADWDCAERMEMVAEYHGAVEHLCSVDHSLAMALAMNRQLPAVGGSAAAALSKLVDISKPEAVQFFTQIIAGKDEKTVAFASCATHVGLRLRNAAWDMAKSAVERQQAQETLKSILKCNVDPSVLFPTHPEMIHEWARQFQLESMKCCDVAPALLRAVEARRVLPRRISMDTLSAMCLSDVERKWLGCSFATPGGDTAVSPVSDRPQWTPHSSNLLANQVVGQVQSAIFKDVKRTLVDNRLLAAYAAYLEAGVLEATHASFPSFLEECGECHRDGELPAHIRFTLPLSFFREESHERQHTSKSTSSKSSSTSNGGEKDESKLQLSVGRLFHGLAKLAPMCSFWRTLLANSPQSVHVHFSPHDTVTATVDLPGTHECVEVSRSKQRSAQDVKTLLPVVFEDKDVIVFNKPAGIASSRHGLSVTQLNGERVEDVISILMASPTYGEVVTPLFRCGQIHRLDVNTSGCLIVAKSSTAGDSLRHQIGTNAVLGGHAKVYLALCVALELDLQRIRLHGTLRDPKDSRVTTQYRVLEFFRESRIVLVECRILQGKKHQIRRHLAAAGMPILQDEDHGGAACCSALINRVALHASTVSFVHPRTQHVVTAHAPLTADMVNALKTLRAANTKRKQNKSPKKAQTTHSPSPTRSSSRRSDGRR